MAFYSQSPVRFGSVSMVTATRGANDPEVGARLSVGNDDYVFCYNAGNSAITPGHSVTVSSTSGYSVTVSTTTSVDFPVAHCKHATLPTGTYGWLLTKGFARVIMQGSNSCTAGQVLAVAADGEYALKSNSTGYPAPAMGKSVEAITSGGSGMAYISIY